MSLRSAVAAIASVIAALTCLVPGNAAALPFPFYVAY